MQFPEELLAGEQISASVLSAHCPPAAEQALHTWLTVWEQQITCLYAEPIDCDRQGERTGENEVLPTH